MIELRDLKGDMHDLAATIGVETTFKLCTLFGGDNIYIPRLAEKRTETSRKFGKYWEKTSIKDLSQVLAAQPCISRLRTQY